MARHKDINWNLHDNLSIDGGYQAIACAVLMDIRDELKRINATLGCHNFLNIPCKLDDIIQNTARKRRKPRRATKGRKHNQSRS